jgi:D-alanine-D-alanine ligase-like ATP-grasp enzyme
VESLEVEPGYGYVARLTYHDGGIRMIRGNDIGINDSAACDVVKDKAYTKYFLNLSGFSTPAGRAFLLPWWAAEFGAKADDPLSYAAELGFPLYVKPTEGSKGRHVWRVDGTERLEQILAQYERERVRVAVIERAIELSDNRLTVLDGRLVAAYRRIPLTVIGDGRSTIEELLPRRPDLVLRPADARVDDRLGRLGLDRTSVPAAGESVRLLDLANLSLGGTAVDLTDRVAPRWRRLALDVAAVFGLRFCGVDLACADLCADDGDYAVIEVNGSPGLDQYASLGERQATTVRELYARLLGEPERDLGFRSSH